MQSDSRRKASRRLPLSAGRAISFECETPVKEIPPTRTRANSIHSVSPEKRKQLSRGDVLLVRNRRVQTVLKLNSITIRDVVLRHTSNIGLVRSSGGDKSGVLIGKNMFLTTKHGSTIDVVNVLFCDYSQGVKFTRTGHYLDPASEKAKATGVHLGGHSDFALIEFAPSVTRSFTPPEMCNDEDPIPEYLIHMGCKNGTDVKVSVAGNRDVPLTTALMRNMQIIGKTVLWSNRNTKGVVTECLSSGWDNAFWIQIQSKGGLHTFEVRNESIIKHFKNGKLSLMKLYLQEPMYIGQDHIIVGHNSGSGSSGGAYFTPDGKLYAVHRGRIHQCLMAGDPIHYFVNHMASMPWRAQTTTFIDSYLILEEKVKPGHSKQGEHVFNAFGEFVFQEVLLKHVPDGIPSDNRISNLLATMDRQVVECIDQRNHETFATASVGCKSNAAVYGDFQETVRYWISCNLRLEPNACVQRYLQLMSLRNRKYSTTVTINGNSIITGCRGLELFIVDYISFKDKPTTRKFLQWYEATFSLMDSLFCNMCLYFVAYRSFLDKTPRAKVKPYKYKVPECQLHMISSGEVSSWFSYRYDPNFCDSDNDG